MPSSISTNVSGNYLDKSLIAEKEIEGFPTPLENLQAAIGITFSDLANLRAALTHPSYWGDFMMPEIERLERSYERLEFLGDSVIGLTVCTHLFNKHTASHQGKLSKLKSSLVSRKTLAEVANNIGLGDYIRIGRGVREDTQRDLSTFLGDCYESLVAAIYLEHGFDRAAAFVLSTLSGELHKIDTIGIQDHKSTLQEIAQKKFKCLPQYILISQVGPDHNKTFTVEVTINGALYGTGTGFSKKQAEANAAHEALQRIRH